LYSPRCAIERDGAKSVRLIPLRFTSVQEHRCPSALIGAVQDPIACRR
jgi:hypothetical protein